MFRRCAVCGFTVARQYCHKNRYKEYICRTCQAAGARFTWPARLRYWRRQTPAIIALSLVATLLGALAIWAVYASVLGIEAAELHKIFTWL